ncbi:MAG: zinc-binding dehydrogenase [Bacteroidota bacterium]
MKALILSDEGQIEIANKPVPKLSKNQVLVKVKAAGLNKRDQFIREGKYPGIILNTTLGSDASGVVESVNDPDSDAWLGKEVIVNPNSNWGPNPNVQSARYSILGMPKEGTLAEYLVTDSSRLSEKPNHLSFEEAAALPLGGLTAFRACFHHGKIMADKNVLISGFGGGVAQFAFQFAQAVKANAYVTSSSEDKLQKALDAGAKGAFNYKDPDWHKNVWKTKGGFDVVIDSAGGDQINTFIKLMRPAGTIVFFGATNGLPSTLDLYRMFWNQVALQGSTMGSDKEFEEMVRFVDEHKIHPMLDSVRPFDEAISAFDDMAQNKKTGKLVLKL